METHKVLMASGYVNHIFINIEIRILLFYFIVHTGHTLRFIDFILKLQLLFDLKNIIRSAKLLTKSFMMI